VVLCLAAAATLAHRAAAGRWELGEVPAVDARRVEAARQKVNPNTASAASLRRLPELGPVRAAAILDYREAHGAAALRGLQDLQGVRGIGPATAEALREYLEFAPGGG
jgi:competence protein ComEA